MKTIIRSPKGAFLLLFLTITISAGATVIKSNPPITIRAADRQQLEGKKYIAAGNVEISWEQYLLYTDYFEFDLESKELLAKGRVTLTSQNTVISGDRFKFNLENKTGELADTYGQLSPSTRYTTDRLEVKDRETIAFEHLDFTPCAQCVPRWKITCSGGHIKKEKYIEMKNLLFKVKNVPVFYLPYLRYPLPKNGKATGFLFPVMGTSPLQGTYFKNAFFWNIKSNIDLTLGLDYYSKAGIGIADELRYLFGNTEGSITFYFFKYRNRFLSPDEETAGSSDEWKPAHSSDFFIKMRHIQKFDLLKTRVTIDIDKQSDPNFIRFFSDDFDNVQQLTHRSSIAANISLSRLKLAANASDYETYIPADGKSTITRYLPSVELNLNQQKIWKLPGYFSLSGTYITKTTREKLYSSEAEAGTNPLFGVPLTSILIKPSYTLPLLKAPWANANVTLKSYTGWYPRSRDPEAEKFVLTDESLTTGYQTANFTLKGPVFSRIFELKTSKIKHVIEPQITIKYATNPDELDKKRLISKDGFYYNESSTLGFQLTSRLLYKSKVGKSSAREILTYTIKQEYYFEPVLANRNRTVDGIYPEFSQLSNILRFRPISQFILDVTVNYNHYIKALNQMVFSLNYTNPASILSGNLRYARTINQYLYDTTPSEEETDTEKTDEEETEKTLTPLEAALTGEVIGGTLNFNKSNFPLKLSTRLDYNIKNKQFSYGTLLLSYDFQCINFNFKVTTFRLHKRLETRFRFGISFGNLGMVRDFLGGR